MLITQERLFPLSSGFSDPLIFPSRSGTDFFTRQCCTEISEHNLLLESDLITVQLSPPTASSLLVTPAWLLQTACR